MNNFVANAKRQQAKEQAKVLRFKRPMLESLNLGYISETLWVIEEEAEDVHWHEANGSLLEAFDGDEEGEFEFKLAFGCVASSAEHLLEAIQTWFDNAEDNDAAHRNFNDCLVALIGNRYREVGWDDYEEDYFSLCGYEEELAQTEAGKRLCRKTKAEMIALIGQCLGIVLAFSDIQLRHDRLSATLDILRGKNVALIDTIKRIEELYDAGEMGTGEWASLVSGMSDRIWLE